MYVHVRFDTILVHFMRRVCVMIVVVMNRRGMNYMKETIERNNLDQSRCVRIHYRLHAFDQRLIPEQPLVHPVFIVHVPRSVIATRSLQRDNIDRRVQFAHFLHISGQNENEGGSDSS